jgi:GntR family transcriptional regulator, trigonelline degradation regulator
MSVDKSLHVSGVVAPVRTQVLHNVRQAILSRRFVPGQRLIERELCELTGVSRTPVREALRQLESEGLVVMVPNRGPVVAEITPVEAAEIYDARAALESLAARRFAERATDEEVDELRARLADIEGAVRDGRLTGMVERKDEFYAVLFGGARNQIIGQMMDSLQARIAYLRATSLATPGRSQETVTEIRKVVDAIGRRDPDAAERLSRAHVERAAAFALASLGDNAVAASGS